MSFRKQLKATFKDVFGGGSKDKESDNIAMLVAKEKKAAEKATTNSKKGKGLSPYASGDVGSGSSSKGSMTSVGRQPGGGGNGGSVVFLSIGSARGGDGEAGAGRGGPNDKKEGKGGKATGRGLDPVLHPGTTTSSVNDDPLPPKYTPPQQAFVQKATKDGFDSTARPPTENADDTPYRAWDRALALLSTSERLDLLHHGQMPNSSNDEHTVITDLLNKSRDLLAETESRMWTFTNPFTGQQVSLRSKLYSIVNRINTYVKIGDIALQHSPEVTALVWAGVRFMMSLIASDSETWAVVVETMEAIAGLMGRCRVYERLYADERTEGAKRVMEALVGLYANMLVFSVKTKRYFAKTNRRRIATSAWKPFQLAFEPVMENMKRWEDKVEKEARAAADEIAAKERESRSKETQELRGMLDELTGTSIPQLTGMVAQTHTAVERIREAQKEEERLAILQWLSQVKYLDNHKTTVKLRQEGTGGWLFERSEWKEWFGKTAEDEEMIEEWWNVPLIGEDGKEVAEVDDTAESTEAVEAKNVGGLWLCGLPGTGKTILTSLVIDHLTKHIQPTFPSPPSPSSLLAYFYCSYTEAPRRTALSFLAAILKQLSTSLNPMPENDPTGLGLPKALVTAYQAAKKQGFSAAQLDLQEMEDIILKEILPSPGLKRVYIIIDALDEMEEKSRKELYPILQKLVNFGNGDADGCKVKIFIASRSGQRDVRSALGKECWARMRLEKGDTGGDIKKYVEVQTEKAIEDGELLEGDVDEELKKEIIEKLVKGAEGMFLWVRYQIANLCEQETEHDLHLALQNLPAGIEDTYTTLLSKISSQPPSRKRLAERVIKWMLCTARPLTPRELVEAVAIDPITDKDCLDPKKMAKGVEAIVDVCGNLIAYDEQLGVLRFVHFTVQEFLEKRFVGVQDAQGGVAEVCLTLLCFRNGWRLASREDVGSYGRNGKADIKDSTSGTAGSGEGEPEDKEKKGEFADCPVLHLAEYAVLNWGRHIRHALASSQDETSSLNSLLLDTFFASSQPYFQAWLKAYTSLTSAFYIHIQDVLASRVLPNQLFIALYFRLPLDFITNDILPSNPTLATDPYPENKWTLYHLAAAVACPHVITPLVQIHHPSGKYPVDINSRDISGRTALHTIAASRRTSSGGTYVSLSPAEARTTVELLRYGADVELKDNHAQNTPIHIACETGNVSVLRALLVECIPSPPRPISLPTPAPPSGLPSDITWGIKKLSNLLERHLNVWGLTPLHVTVLSRQIQTPAKCEIIMHLLPLGGHDPNARDSFNYTPLERLVRDNPIEIMGMNNLGQFLYDVGGNWDPKKQGLGTVMGRKVEFQERMAGAGYSYVFHGMMVPHWRNVAGVGMGRRLDIRIEIGGRGRFDTGFVEKCWRWL